MKLKVKIKVTLKVTLYKTLKVTVKVTQYVTHRVRQSVHYRLFWVTKYLVVFGKSSTIDLIHRKLKRGSETDM